MRWWFLEDNEIKRRMQTVTLATVTLACLTILVVGVVVPHGTAARATAEGGKALAPAYVSSATCAECHAKAYSTWRNSDHSWALREPTPENVLGDFDDTVFEHRSVRSRFFTRNGKFFVETDGPGGKLAEFEIRYTVGVSPLQQYLVELENGQLQALDIAWDTEQNRWFHLYPDQKLASADGLHWSGPYKNWQARCATCHQTNFAKAYSPKQRSYQSTWSELTVGCEACHGPGNAHVVWAKDPEKFRAQGPQGVDAKGLTVTFAQESPETEIQACAPCHSRRSAFGANSAPPGAKSADHYRIALLRSGLYHADGQIDDEVYVYASFLQSKMNAKGVRCSNCHEPHSGKLRAEGNAVCTQCHNPSGNAAFPTLRMSSYDDPSHHHHKAGSESAQCVNCHMPAKTYMQVDPRRDHSFRVPRPDLSVRLRTPNACTGCHDDRTADWAASKVKTWFPDGQSGSPHFGEVLHLGRTSPSRETGEKLLTLAGDSSIPAIVRATALGLLHRSVVPGLTERIAPLLKDRNDLVRSASLRLHRTATPEHRIKVALSLVSDPVRSVRMEAAQLLIGMPLGTLSERDRREAGRAITSYQRSLFSRADFPETQMQIAGLAMVLKDFRVAQEALQTAINMDPQFVDAWLTLARIQSALHQPKKAQKTLEQAANNLPENGLVLRQLGSRYAQNRQHDRAVRALKKSRALSGDTPLVLEMLAVSSLALGQSEQAIAYAVELAKRYPTHRAGPAIENLLRRSN